MEKKYNTWSGVHREVAIHWGEQKRLKEANSSWGLRFRCADLLGRRHS